MTFAEYLLFPTPIYIDSISGNQLTVVQNEIKNVVNNYQFDDPWNNERIKISGGNFTDNQLVNLDQFKLSLSDMVGKYLKMIDEKDYVSYSMEESWITKSTKYSYAHIHNHSNFDISGVYYYKTNTMDGNLFFENPITECIASKIGRKKFLKDTISYQPEVGKFILFPSWLKHGVDTNTTDNERISLSFNLRLLNERI
jgi:uncharacterized protein (TIGR02466 family)